MAKRKLIVTHDINDNLIKAIKRIIPDWELYTGKDTSIWIDHLADAEIIAGWKKEIAAQKLNKLKWIQAWSAGVNSMPLSVFEEREIQLTSANGVHAYPISETIFALLLGLTRNIHTYVKNQQTRTWHHGGIKLELHGKTIGIIGVGAIGKETAKIAKAFGMHVIGIRHSGNPAEFVDEMHTVEQLNHILPQCDYVVITLPLTSETHGLFGKEQFTLMKQSAFLINIGRGEIIDEDALITALEDRQIAGAGLDVFEHEPLHENSPLWELDNVIITPHTAGSTEHYNNRVIQDIFIPNLKSYLKEEKPAINLVDYAKGY